MSDLINKKCTPCSGNTPKLSKKEIETIILKIDNWKINDNYEMIFKKFSFKNFKDAITFANVVGDLSEKEGHHPDISLGWGYCLIMIHTHAIKGLSDNDFILASKIDKILN
tara:strand:+ start:149 stop:481 length:333 start_codon:yes stop_codon:yes gene_type:complete